MDANHRNPLVTIVLPTYNVEQYLEECLDSVVQQTYENLEIICVNDGSTDGSRDILERYAQNDSRIRILDQENTGIGGARNNGLAIATGDYITFWDTDDYFALNAIELMLNKMLEYEADICMCDVQRFDNETGELMPASYIARPYPEKEVFNWEDWAECLFLNSAVSCNKLMRMEFLRKNDIRYPDIHIYEDFDYSMMSLRLAERIVLVKKKLTFYRRNRKGSLTYDPAPEMYEAIMSHTRTWDKMMERGLLDDQRLRNSFMQKTAIDYRFFIRSFGRFEDFETFFNMVFSDISILKYYDPENGVIPIVEYFRVKDAKTYAMEEYYRQYESYAEQRQVSIKRYQEIVKLKRRIKRIRENTKLKTKAYEEEKQNLEMTVKDLRDEADAAQKEAASAWKEVESVKAVLLTEQKHLKEQKALLTKKEKALQETESCLADRDSEVAALKSRLAEVEKKLSVSRRKYKKVTNSFSYKLGRALTWLPRKIKSLFKKKS